MIRKIPSRIGLIVPVFLFFLSCNTDRPSVRSVIDLSGTWQFRPDPGRDGAEQRWFEQELPETVQLPGTLDENRKGVFNRDTTELHLNRLYTYTGSAWFRKKIVIPDSWKDRHIDLIMERTKVSRVWVDSVYIRSDNSLFSPQIYDLTESLRPGAHVLTIEIDNRPDLVPVAGSHAYSEDTQTNWLGILGRFQLEASGPVRLGPIRVTPDIRMKQMRLRVPVVGAGPARQDVRISLGADARNTGKRHHVPELSGDFFPVTKDTLVELTCPLGKDAQLWSEFDPVLYRLTIRLENDQHLLDMKTIETGLREFGTRGKQFIINGKTTFLRGRHDACVFPLTGYPPMKKEGWIRVFRIARDYGLNHVRFHSWCPPEAAFEAADICGVYLQPELPIWWSFDAGDPKQVAFMMKEGRRLLDCYGNHASFVMFALGNEIWEDRAVLKEMITGLRAHDSRPLYAQGSNNRLSNPSYAEGDDYWTTFRTDVEQKDMSSDVRGSISFLDSKLGEGGILNTRPPSTSTTFTRAIQHSPVPVIGHETGQYQIYPNYAETAKYTGVLKPWNFEIFRRRLTEQGLSDQAEAFFRASGLLSLICYREEIEMAIRTPGFGGFQLLDLQDYPGQGTALVGLLDAFMDSKGLVRPELFRSFCNETVLQLLMPRYVWMNDELFEGDVQVAHYGNAALAGRGVQWEISAGRDRVGAGEFRMDNVPQGKITPAGRIVFRLDRFRKAQKLTVSLKMDSLPVPVTYPVWVYPTRVATEIPGDIHVVTGMGELTQTVQSLKPDEKILFFPIMEEIREHSVEGQFIPDFWNWAMFKSLAEQYGGRPSPGTLGLLMNPEHPAFSAFPTEMHANWQWWSIIKAGRPVILDQTEPSYRPIVQVIDNISRNHKLGLIFEFKIGGGKLLVCSVDRAAIRKQPEMDQLFSSLVQYMGSAAFDPLKEVSMEALNDIL